MVEILIWIAVFVASLFVLIKASDYFTDSAEKIGLFFGLPAFIVGVTIVAIGTSLPELISSIFAVLRNSSEIVVGNVIGSNITNIFLILGIAAIVGKKLKITYELTHVDLPILVGSAFLFAAMIWDGVFSLGEALLSIVGIIIYFLYTVNSEREYKDVEIKKEMKEELRKKKKLDIKTIAILVLSAVFIFIGARYTIESVIELSEIFNLGKEIIAVSAVALGTSLPELAVSITAVRKGKPEIAVGNILGSNIFNTFVVMGVSALFGVLIIPQSILTFALPMMLIATLMFFFITQTKEVTKWEGYLLLL
ncbi:MAG: calcium/sodium antiporter, partial [Nanoarchaeota archaeon]|nr:calcium/sodium antiporter [Nanoarchaeota archaeon]